MKNYWFVGLFVGVIIGTGVWMASRESYAPHVTTVPDEPYDIQREIAFEGTVVRIDPPPCTALPFYSYHLHLQLAKEIVEIHLGPCFYALEQKIPLKVGDRIQGIGAEVSWRSGPRRVFVAREIRQGKKRWLFRNVSGQPLWTSDPNSNRR